MAHRSSLWCLGLCGYRGDPAVLSADGDAAPPLSRRYRSCRRSSHHDLLDVETNRRADGAAVGLQRVYPELHRRLAAAGSLARLSSGLRPGIYTMIVAALAFVGLAMTALLLRALFTGEFAGVVFIIGFAIFFGWQISGFHPPQQTAQLHIQQCAGRAVAVVTAARRANANIRIAHHDGRHWSREVAHRRAVRGHHNEIGLDRTRASFWRIS